MAMEDEFTRGGDGHGGTDDGLELEACLSDPNAFVVELVSFVAEATDRETEEMPPLSEAIDPEAVQRILESDHAGSATVRFDYAGCEVTVTAGGEIVLLL